ncbi:Putative vitellogenin receptor [Gryllus bimaculatus]|nr:Putative vitellogenin receptor [Gryllus bimaculatus]
MPCQTRETFYRQSAFIFLFNMCYLYRLLFLLIWGTSFVLGIPRDLLYNYGPTEDDKVLKGHSVNTHGLISFLTDIPGFVNIQFPLDYPVIAPFYANVDIKNTGNVYFRETKNDALLKRATDRIRSAFSSGKFFTATSLFITTWNEVGYYNLGSDKVSVHEVNTFQVVVASNGTDSYAEFIYPEGGIQWIEGANHESRLPDARAQVGMVAGDGRYYTLRTSGRDQVQHIERSSNIGIRGVWMFHIGQVQANGNVNSPDLIKSDPIESVTCAARGSTTCHSKAQCFDFETGFCCECKSGYFGNGINCLTNGKMFSRMSHFFMLEGVPVQHPYEMEHVVEYVECKNHPLNFTTLHMKITRNLVVYEAHDEIVRYGMTSKMMFPQDRDPCEEGRKTCIRHSSCVVDGDSYKCICHPGYQYILLENSTDAACVDVNECASGINNCHSYAECINEEGSYSCRCKPGYNGDGRLCEAEDCNVANNCSPFATCQFDTLTQKYTCVCIPGYYGDGLSCYETDSVTANCNNTDCWCPYDFVLEGLMCLKKKTNDISSEEVNFDESCIYTGICPPHSSCQYNEESGRHECRCDEGYNLQGSTCALQEPQQECENTCHENAHCAYDTFKKMFKCRCNLGYRGDGIHCEREVTPCNLVNNCKTGEECVYDKVVQGYKCKCKKSHRRMGNRCIPEETCLDDPSMCSPDATCVASSENHFQCKCNEGFVGNGVTCTPMLQERENQFLVTQGMAVLKITVSKEKNESRPIVMKLFQEAVGIDVDCLRGRLYWSDIAGKVIKSSFYNGSDVQIFLDTDLGSLEGLSIDWISRNIYWTDSHRDTIEVANIDHKGRKILISNGLTNPRGIVVHPELGKMFWSDWNRNRPKIESSNLDGTERHIFLESILVGLPNSLAIDWSSNELCWADAGIHAIGCADISTSESRIVVDGIKYPFGLAITPSSYFWTDWETQKIESAQKNSGHRNHAIITLSPAIGKLYGIVAARKECPRLTNNCAYKNGFCGSEHLCLPKGSREHNCVCANFNEEGSGSEFSCNEIV